MSSFITFLPDAILPVTGLRQLLVAVLGASLLLLPLLVSRRITDPAGNRTPPGPLLRRPFLGKYPERLFQKWHETYGPLFSLWLGNQLFVLVSDPVTAKELFVTNGAIFSGRKLYFMKNQTILRGRAITASQYGSKWRQHRRIAMTLLTPKAIEGYAHVLDYEAHILIKSLYNAAEGGNLPVNPAHYAGRYALNNMLTVSFATRTDSTTDPLVERALALAVEFMDLTGPYANAVDFIVPLQWIPTSTRTRGRRLNEGMMEVYGAMIERVRERILRGEDVPDCLVKTLINTQEEEKLDWEDTCMLAAVFTLGGVHSTAGVIQWFLALITAYPEVQARAHAELDAVIGRDTWPSAHHESQLPYIRAIIKEVERAHAPFWNGTPHCSTADYVTSTGVFIPKGTVVVLNCHALHHNQARYEDAAAFDPDRYLGDELTCADSARLNDPMQRDHWTFGVGRRMCPGVSVAERELFLAIARLLWSFRVEAVPGEPINLEEYEGESGRTPLPYRVQLLPRHDGVAELLESRVEVKLLNLKTA